MSVPLKVVCVAGARPNFMKIAPIMRALAAYPPFGHYSGFDVKLVHTGQHYDAALSQIFFDELHIPKPAIELAVGSGSHAWQTAQVMERFEAIVRDEAPQAVIVVGDVNSTLACGLVCAKISLETRFDSVLGSYRRPLVVHVEAGLRSFDNEMPEEVNRRVTDTISDILFVSDPAGIENLKREGVDDARIFFVGNVMIDTLEAARVQAMRSTILERIGVSAGNYALLTLHRPANVDDPQVLRDLIETLDEIAENLPIVFPLHPRTRSTMSAMGIILSAPRWQVIEPQGYFDFLKLISSARVVLTDSGGIQEETTVLGVFCLTLRENTERPVTISEGTNRLVGTDREAILSAYHSLSDQPLCDQRRPQLWDGHAAARIAKILAEVFVTTESA